MHFDFPSDIGKGGFVRYCHSFEDVNCLTSFCCCTGCHGSADSSCDRGRHGDGLRGRNKVNVREATFREVALYGDRDVADLDPSARRQGSLVWLLIGTGSSTTGHGRHGLLMHLLWSMAVMLRLTVALGGL